MTKHSRRGFIKALGQGALLVTGTRLLELQDNHPGQPVRIPKDYFHSELSRYYNGRIKGSPIFAQISPILAKLKNVASFEQGPIDSLVTDLPRDKVTTPGIISLSMYNSMAAGQDPLLPEFRNALLKLAADEDSLFDRFDDWSVKGLGKDPRELAVEVLYTQQELMDYARTFRLQNVAESAKHIQQTMRLWRRRKPNFELLTTAQAYYLNRQYEHLDDFAVDIRKGAQGQWINLTDQQAFNLAHYLVRAYALLAQSSVPTTHYDVAIAETLGSSAWQEDTLEGAIENFGNNSEGFFWPAGSTEITRSPSTILASRAKIINAEREYSIQTAAGFLNNFIPGWEGRAKSNQQKVFTYRGPFVQVAHPATQSPF